MKKGVSALISTVLMIAFAVTLFLLISNWIKGSIIDEATSQTEDKLTSQLNCFGATLEISGACVDDVDSATTVTLNVDNFGDESVSGITVRVLGGDGSLGTFVFTPNSDVPPLGRILSKSAGAQTLSGGPVTTPNKIEVYPVVGGTLCTNQVETVRNIKAC